MKYIFESQKKYLEESGNISLEKRIESLKNLKQTIKKYEREIYDALYFDLGKPELESYVSEVGFIYSSIDYALKNIKKWMKPKRVRNESAQITGKSYIYKCAHGVVLIVGPYNYPFQLSIEPLVGAIAGGNCCILKPSEYTPQTEKIIQKIITETFDEKYIKVVTGDYKVNSELLDMPFDYIFFTGSVNVGKIVMEKASKNLTPITLELGGKSPVIVDETCDLEISARRICWGKFYNTGQTCVAPDYLLVNEKIYDKFLELLKKTIIDFYGNNIKENKDFGRIVNDRHTKRIVEIIKKDYNKVYFGGEYDIDKKYISPTILKDITFEDESMKDEIFGPILPVIKYKNIDDIKLYLKKYEKPLALYVFSRDEEFINYIINNFSFGGGCVNDTITHVASNNLPFGGVGTSGIGRYHGINSFKTFTYEKSIVKKNFRFDVKLVFPPYKDKLNKVKRLIK